VWTVDYRRVKISDGERAADGPWIPLLVECAAPEDAWRYLHMITKTTDLTDYYAAQVRPVR